MQLDRDKAAGIFIDSLIAHAYQGAVRTIVELLNNVPRGLKNSERWVNLHRWYAQLSPQDQSSVRAIIEEATSSAVFNTLNIFDGTAGTLIRGKYVDLLIRMLVYADSKSWRDESPEIIVDLNPSTSTDNDLHDLFMRELQELSADGEKPGRHKRRKRQSVARQTSPAR